MIKEYKPEGRNNESRKLFKKFCQDTGFARADPYRNVFIRNSERVCFVLESTKSDIRQLYDDCVGVYVNELGYFPRDKLHVSDKTRLRPGGTPARNATYTPSQAEPL